MKSLYEELNGSYIEIGDVKIPALMSVDTNYEIGFWGQRHKAYLKENHRVIYYNLLTKGKLNSYLHKIDNRAKEQYDLIVKLFSESQGITEELKAENQMEWVGRMNNIRDRITEFVSTELMYT